LKPGVTMEQARADMNAVTTHIAQQYPKSNKGWGAYVEPLKNDFIPKERIRTLWMLLGAVAFVLLIACVNVANLLLARSMARQKEMAVRSSLGATPRTIFTQLLTESILLALIGGPLGVGVGYAMLHAFMAAMPEGTLPSEADLSLNFPVLLFTLGATTLAGLLFGCVPAWHASRVDPSESLKEGGRSGTGVGRKRLRQALVIGEFTLALSLLAGDDRVALDSRAGPDGSVRIDGVRPGSYRLWLLWGGLDGSADTMYARITEIASPGWYRYARDIMCDFSVDLDSICTRHGSLADAMLQSAPRLRNLVSDGVVELDGASLAVPVDSRFLVRSVAAAFDAHLDRSQRLHSRAV